MNRKGLNLPEVLIMILLLSILFTLGILFSAQFKSTKKLKNKEIAIALAQQAVEVLRAAPFSLVDDADAGNNSVEADLNTDSGPTDLLEPLYTAGAFSYSRKVEVKTVPIESKEKNAKSPLKHVSVTVSWKSADGQDEEISLSTAIADLN
ncbi:MAG: hypothetical protein HQM10_08020 [Candidatus Riflebacteria bacterium]|nr:hypothetical protein [Candidatus Riflebacteria bacterium]